eukprot:scaffold13511_cov132-Isochrysis_galbana.AAC.3
MAAEAARGDGAAAARVSQLALGPTGKCARCCGGEAWRRDLAGFLIEVPQRRDAQISPLSLSHAHTHIYFLE